ncbi:PAN2-PAN3 deadenylation complex catalytic subunit PAN2 isoform X2 [Arctopsyche grandis]|uniref:PAN2-PAN3 deadenylation complex catalytic subunit PAN2 isoform X2 n=1 Tax=Arctopsyche grandis TaxID=121162 RepID=UPI00406D7F59
MDYLNTYPATGSGQYTSYYVDPYRGNGGDLEYHQIGTVLSDGGDNYGVSSVVFDKYEELFWMGNQGGHVTSYYGPTMQRHTSFQIHASEDVRSLLSIDQGILALTKSSLKLHIRRGIPKFTYKSCNMMDMQCLVTMNNNRIIMGGHQNKLVDFDLNRLKEVNQHLLDTPESNCAILRRHSHMLATGDPRGAITLHDPVSLKTQHVINTHSASLSDFDIQDNLIVSCGFSMNGSVSCDCFLLAYDIRTMRPLPPLALCCEPLLLRFIPPGAGQLAAVASQGRVQLVNTSHRVQSRVNLFQMDTQNSQCLSFDVSATGQTLVFGDQSGNLHLFSLGQNSEPLFNEYSRETEFADTPEELPSVSITDDSFLLSSVPRPPLFPGRNPVSDWPKEFTKTGYRLPKPIDAEILKNMKMQGPIGCAPNPRNTLRNQIPYVFEQPTSPCHSKNLENSVSNNSENEGSVFVAIPKRYRKVEVRYSKLGSNDFDFDQYNRTGFPGLEANLPNSYCNSMLQVLYYNSAIKMTLLKHTCNKEFCLSCELGFLFRMLDTSSGAPCQASNFLRAFRTVPEASALGLILSNNPETRSKTNLGSLIQSWNRFILHQMHYEILETRKREKETVSGEQELSLRKISNHIKALSVNSSYINNKNSNPYWDKVALDDADFPEIGKKVQKKKLDVEDVDGLSVVTQDEGKYMWLSSSVLVNNTSDFYDSLDCYDTDLSSAQHCMDGKENNEYALDNYGGTEDLNLIDVDDSQYEENIEPSSSNDSKNKINSEETDVSKLFGTKQFQIHKCLKCNREERKESIALLCNLQYPSQIPVEPVAFSDLLRASLCPRRTTPAWCESCRRFTPTLQSCSVRQLPELLAINCGLSTTTDRAFWQKQMDHVVASVLNHTNVHEKFANSSASFSTKSCRYGSNCSRPGCKFKHPDDPITRGSSSSAFSALRIGNPSLSSRTLHHLYIQNPWLPQEIEARLTKTGDLVVNRTDISSVKNKGDISNIHSTNPKVKLDQNGVASTVDDKKLADLAKQYSLSAVVCHIEDVQKNIVSFVKMNGDDHRVPQNGQPQWFLFNDFCVSPILAAEVTWFNLEWKVPCVLFYSNKTLTPNDHPTHTSSGPLWNGLSSFLPTANKIFFEDGRIVASPTVAFTPLAAHEMPKSGELVGMDAEFVTLNQEEAELKSDGRLSTIRPSRLAVARITCVRGQGPMEGTPFIDDYISTQEQVVDYLTKFSGIKPGDLDANFSSKHLTTLKSTYQKLRYLVDTGVIFVGHGLKNDFRVINLVVPPEQVIDTVQLFHLPHHRMVSLKFLAWHLLGTKIQSDTHDSTEDARTALQLYKRYLELEAEGVVTASLASLYETGKTLQWKVPDD